MTLDFTVENIKCSGCTHSIHKALMAIAGVTDVRIDIDTQHIQIQGDADRDTLVRTLRQLGYPEAGHNSLGAKAKSMVSCAIGRIQHD